MKATHLLVAIAITTLVTATACDDDKAAAPTSTPPPAPSTTSVAPAPPPPPSAAPTTTAPVASSTTKPPAASSTPAGDLSGPGTSCGIVTTAADNQVMVFIRKGQVSCPKLLDTYRSYYTKLRNGEAPGNGGGGEIQVNDWTCSTGPGADPVTKCASTSSQEAEGILGNG